MTDNPLVSPDANINPQNYGVTKGNPLSAVFTEGYGASHDETDGVPLTGWLNGLPVFSDSNSLIMGAISGAHELTIGIQTGNWANTSAIAEAIAGGVGLAGDGLGFVADPLGTVVQWAVLWVLQHFVPLREALDGLTGNPEAISGYATTWNNIAERLAEVGTEFAQGAETGPGQWSGETYARYHAMAADLSGSIVAAAAVAKGLATVVAGVGKLVEAVRNMVAYVIAVAVQFMLVDIPEMILGDEAASEQIFGTAIKVEGQVAELIMGILDAIGKITTFLPLVLGIVTGILGAEQKWTGQH